MRIQLVHIKAVTEGEHVGTLQCLNGFIRKRIMEHLEKLEGVQNVRRVAWDIVYFETKDGIKAQDVLDDTNSTPVLSEENGHLYLYESTSFHLGWRSSSTADIPVWKIDAETGEILWHTDYTCFSMSGVSGGVQSTIAVGHHELSDRIFVTVSMTGSATEGVLACLDKKTGKSLWEHHAGYAWSSPVCVYRPDGSGNVIYCSSDGNMYLLDGKTGEVYDTLRLSQGVIEASPAVYKDMAVVGTRACTTYGIRLS